MVKGEWLLVIEMKKTLFFCYFKAPLTFDF